MSAALLRAVKDWLDAETGSSFTSAVGGRFYHLGGPENVALPAAAYTIAVPARPRRFLNTTAAEEVWLLAFSIWVDAEQSDTVAALAIEDRLFARLEGVSLSASGYDRVQVLSVARGACSIEEDTIRVDSEYQLRGVRTA